MAIVYYVDGTGYRGINGATMGYSNLPANKKLSILKDAMGWLDSNESGSNHAKEIEQSSKMLIRCKADALMITHALSKMQTLTMFYESQARVGGEKVYVIEEAE